MKKILACVVIYSPDGSVSSRIEAMAAQFHTVLVVDNTPGGSGFLASCGNIRIFINENKGAISGALNLGLDFARREGFYRMMVFDQDTDISANLLGSLQNFLDRMPEVGVVGPAYKNSSTGFPGRIVSCKGFFRRGIRPDVGSPSFEALFVINSCALLAIDRIPGDFWYDESLIVDNVDVDFCLALRRRNLSIYCCPDVQVSHGIGARKKGAARWSATNYSSFRKYLQSRNRVVVWRRYLLDHPGFVLQDIVVWFLDGVRTVLLERDRLNKLQSICRGFFDGLCAAKKRAVPSVASGM